MRFEDPLSRTSTITPIIAGCLWLRETVDLWRFEDVDVDVTWLSGLPSRRRPL